MSDGRSYQPQFEIDTQTAARERVERLRDFYATLFVLTPRVFMTHVILAANVLLFVLMVINEPQAIMNPTIDSLLLWGANNGPRTLNGQPWRLFTCMFVHIGIVHIAINMWILWDIGRLMERVVGNIGFTLLYVTSGLCGSLASLLWNPQMVSAGASGAVFGLFGGLLGFLVLGRGSMPTEVSTSIRSSAITFIGYNLVFGFIVAGVDNAAHIGGLVGGCLCGLCLGQPLTLDAADYRWVRNLLVLVLGGGITAAGLLLIPKPVVFDDVDGAVLNLVKIETDILKKRSILAEQARDKKITADQYADGIETDLLPLWRDAVRRVEGLKNIPEPLKPRVSAYIKYGIARVEYLNAEARYYRNPTEEFKNDLDLKESQVAGAVAEVNRLNAEANKRRK